MRKVMWLLMLAAIFGHWGLLMGPAAADDGFYVISAASIKFRGDWDVNAAYKPRDVVFFNGSSWFCLADNKAVAPDVSPTQWTLLAQKGDIGATGPPGPVNPNADTVDGKHAADFAAAAHAHAFGAITGTLADGQIPAAITRDSELTAGLATKADAAHAHDDRYYTKAQVDALTARIAALETAVGQLTAKVNSQDALLQGVSRFQNEIYFSGVNVHIVNGIKTDSENGLGNLIVGYNELRNDGTDNRTGSHTVVVGKYNNYSFFGGLVVGHWNTVGGLYASVSGGQRNTASGDYASVSGGQDNRASGSHASISGGVQNQTSYGYASVSGGYLNTASGWAASVSGGRNNAASEYYASVSGGYNNTASGNLSSVGGGSANKASGQYASVSGGWINEASGPNASVSGGYNNTASGNLSSVSGGLGNTAIGIYASVSGGINNTASGECSFVGGGGHRNPQYGNRAVANLSAILGGAYNIAGIEGDATQAELSTISGGDANRATGWASCVSGGKNNTVSGAGATVSGGYGLLENNNNGWSAPGHDY